MGPILSGWIVFSFFVTAAAQAKVLSLVEGTLDSSTEAVYTVKVNEQKSLYINRMLLTPAEEKKFPQKAGEKVSVKLDQAAISVMEKPLK